MHRQAFHHLHAQTHGNMRVHVTRPKVIDWLVEKRPSRCLLLNPSQNHLHRHSMYMYKHAKTCAYVSHDLKWSIDLSENNQVDPECCFDNVHWKRTVVIAFNRRKNEVNASKIDRPSLTNASKIDKKSPFALFLLPRKSVLFLSPGSAVLNDSKSLFLQSQKTSLTNTLSQVQVPKSFAPTYFYQTNCIKCVCMSIFKALVWDFFRFSTTNLASLTNKLQYKRTWDFTPSHFQYTYCRPN